MFHSRLISGKFSTQCRQMSSRVIDLSNDVRSALNSKKPIVALESTIITHGMPYPDNLKTAVAVESVVREQGAVPATIAVVKGRIKVGLSGDELEALSRPSKAVKISRRDFPYVLSHKMDGGTTVSGTLMVANSVGIKVFVTGGVGGVHRYGERTLDISADLVEMGRHPIMTVSSGVKSILDIERTLEYLETQGVCVISYGPSKNFPAFYCEESGFLAPYHVSEPSEAANVLFQSTQLGIGSGILLAVPVPKPFSIDREIMDTAINLALTEAEKAGIHGKEVTPFVLERMNRITDGKSLETNIALIKNNALVGAQIAVAYQQIHNEDKSFKMPANLNLNGRGKQVTVVGGSVLDVVVSLQSEVQMDGRSIPSKIRQSCGGVGRNIADSLGKLRPTADSHRPSTRLISAVGDDSFGNIVLDSISHLDSSGVLVVENSRTASYCALVDLNGDAKIGAGDMEILSAITPDLITDNLAIIDSDFLVLDGNVPHDTVEAVLTLSNEHNIPVWFEPTDILKASKPFGTDLWKCISCTSPNMNELRAMAGAAGLKFNEQFNTDDITTLIGQLVYLAQPLCEHIPLLMITMAKLGLLIISWEGDGPLMDSLTHRRLPIQRKLSVRYYPAVPAENVVNSIGAGDSTVAGFIDGLIRGCSEAKCVKLGHKACNAALSCHSAVPATFLDYPTTGNYDELDFTGAEYQDISSDALKSSC